MRNDELPPGPQAPQAGYIELGAGGVQPDLHSVRTRLQPQRGPFQGVENFFYLALVSVPDITIWPSVLLMLLCKA